MYISSMHPFNSSLLLYYYIIIIIDQRKRQPTAQHKGAMPTRQTQYQY
jgi:hypothetical protein